MNHSASGRRREYRVRDDLDSKGYAFVMKAGASKGPADLLHGHPLVGAVLVQVGGAGKTLGPADRERFCNAAELCHALPILATVIATPGKPSRITYWRVTRDVPATWGEWTP